MSRGTSTRQPVSASPPGKLRLFRDAGRETNEHFGGGVAVGKGDDAGDELGIGQEKEALAGDTSEDVPAVVEDFVSGACSDF